MVDVQGQPIDGGESMAKRHRRLDEELVQGALLDRPLSLPQPRKDERTEYQNGGRENEQGERAGRSEADGFPCLALFSARSGADTQRFPYFESGDLDRFVVKRFEDP
jgi:hypothetical protein